MPKAHSLDGDLSAAGICGGEEDLPAITTKTIPERCDAAMSGPREPDPKRQRRPGGAYESYEV